MTACAARAALAASLFASTFTAAAADAPPMNAEMVKPGLYRIAGGGGGGGTVLRLSANGPIVVDANRTGTYPPLMAAIRRVVKTPDQPVRALMLTAVGPEQAGNVVRFVDAGVPVIVQRRALARLAEAANAGGAAARKPPVTYDADYLLRAGDIEVEVEHVGSGRTGVDSVVYFRDLRVVAVGELFTHDKPTPDCASGGSLAGWAAAITHLLWFDFDVAVPSRGAPVGKRELVAFKATLEASAGGPSDCRRPG